jgi:two-component system sensor histidine kinase CpxA
MRTTLVAIVLWALATIAFCAVGIWATARALDWPRYRGIDPMKSLFVMLAEDAGRAFDAGGAEGLAAYLQRLNASLPGERFLLDATGSDLVDGSDRTDLVQGIGHADFGLAGQPDGRLAAVIRPRDGRYRFVWVVELWFEPPSPTPFIAVVVAIIAAMASALALYLSLPLRRLRRVMDRFGRGDLRARVGSRRFDEIGVVSREFDVLAGRVETLVTAERRLLQDVSHELRSPLTRLDVAIDLAIKREDRGPLLQRIRRDVTRLSDLVSELLHLTRAEGDPSARVLDIVRPGDLLRDLVEDCTIEAETKGCRM